MVTIGELVQRIQSLYSKGVQSDDSRLKPRQIYSKLTTVRAKLISQQAKKRQKINQWNYQTLPCIELVEASIYDCSCLPQLGCNVLRSKYQIPKPLTDLDKHLIQSVSTIDGSILYGETILSQLKYRKGAKYTHNNPQYWIDNNYLFVTDKTGEGPKALRMSYIAEDPLAIESFINYCDETCVDCEDCESVLDKEFAIDNNLVDTLIEMSIQELVILFSQSKEDMRNDTRDDIPEQGK